MKPNYFILEDEFKSGEKFSSLYKDTGNEEADLMANFYGPGHRETADEIMVFLILGAKK